MTAERIVRLNSLLQRKPGVNDGRLCLAGTGISVRQIAVWYNAGRSPEEILEDYPKVDLARIHAAIAYYLANQKRMDDEIAADEMDFRASRDAATEVATG